MNDKGESCIEKDGKGVWLHIEVVLKDNTRHDGEQQRDKGIEWKINVPMHPLLFMLACWIPIVFHNFHHCSLLSFEFWHLPPQGKYEISSIRKKR